MEEPALLTDEELAFIQHIYYGPDHRLETNQSNEVLEHIELVKPRKNEFKRHKHVENKRFDHCNCKKISNGHSMIRGCNGNIGSIDYIATQKQRSFTEQRQAQERIKQLEDEIAQLKIRLTDTNA